MTAVAERATPSRAREPGPILLALPDLVELLPFKRQTIYRWRSPAGGREVKLPDPYAVMAKTPVWLEQQILDFAEEKGYAVNKAALRKIRARFGR